MLDRPKVLVLLLPQRPVSSFGPGAVRALGRAPLERPRRPGLTERPPQSPAPLPVPCPRRHAPVRREPPAHDASRPGPPLAVAPSETPGLLGLSSSRPLLAVCKDVGVARRAGPRTKVTRPIPGRLSSSGRLALEGVRQMVPRHMARPVVDGGRPQVLRVVGRLGRPAVSRRGTGLGPAILANVAPPSRDGTVRPAPLPVPYVRPVPAPSPSGVVARDGVAPTALSDGGTLGPQDLSPRLREGKRHGPKHHVTLFW